MAIRADSVHRSEQFFPWVDVIGGDRTAAGMDVNANTALTLSSYFACIRNASEDIGKIPAYVYEQLRPRGRQLAVDHPNYDLLRIEPNEEMSAMTFKETLMHHAMNRGGGFAWIEREDGWPSALWPIHPSRVRIKRDDTKRLVYDVRGEDFSQEGDVRFQQRDMIHIHGLGSVGTNGYVMSALAADAIGLGLASRNYASKFFKHDATPRTVIMYPERMFKSKDAVKHFKQRWQEVQAGENTHKMAVLQEGMKIQQLSVSPEDAQLI